MDFNLLLSFSGKNLLFSFTIIMIAFILGWLLYNHVILRKICLKDSLFERDNLAAWVEFIGAFIYPTLFLAAKAVEGSASENLLVDLAVCAAYVAAYIILFTILRLLSGLVVKLLAAEDHAGKINLNHEIYEQKNISASLFSVALSTLFVSVVRFIDISPDYITDSLLRMCSVLVLTLLSFIVYSIILRRKTTLFKEIFIDNNPAAGVALLGFVFSVETILTNAVILQSEFHLIELLAVSLTSLILLFILSVLFKVIFSSIIKVDIWKEVYEQNSVGAAIGQVALYVGIANVIIHFIK